MSTIEWLTLGIIIVTATYTVGTFLLWRTTKQSLDYSVKQWEKQDQITKANIIALAFSSHRELYTKLLEHESLLEIYSHDYDMAPAVAKKELLATLIVNNLIQIYFLYTHGALPSDIWESIEKDIVDTLAVPFVKDGWEEMKPYVPREFVDFIEGDKAPSPPENNVASKHKSKVPAAIAIAVIIVAIIFYFSYSGSKTHLTTSEKKVKKQEKPAITATKETSASIGILDTDTIPLKLLNKMSYKDRALTLEARSNNLGIGFYLYPDGRIKLVEVDGKEILKVDSKTE